MAQSISNPINTSKVQGRRKLHFSTLDGAGADAIWVAEIAGAGKLKQLGNWTPTQCFNHLGAWVEYAFDGLPIKPPLLYRLLGPLIKGLIIRNPIPAGRQLPKIPGGTIAFDDGPIEPALARLKNAYDRLTRQTPALPSPIFGKMTHEQWIALNCRHAELHLSFYVQS